MQDGRKAVWSIPYVSVAFFPSLKHNFIAYRSSKVSSCPDCIFEIHQLWQLGFSRAYSNCCCSCSFEPEIIKISQSSHKMYSNNIPNFQESMAILNACTKKSGNLLNVPCTMGEVWPQLGILGTLHTLFYFCCVLFEEKNTTEERWIHFIPSHSLSVCLSLCAKEKKMEPAKFILFNEVIHEYKNL